MIYKRNEDTFTLIPNSVLRNRDLSMKAVGLLVYILSLPKDWDIYQKEITTHFKDGLDSVRSGFKELTKKGYIEKRIIKHKNGTISAIEWYVTTDPFNFPEYKNLLSAPRVKSTSQPKRDFPKQDNPKQDNPTVLITENNKILTKEKRALSFNFADLKTKHKSDNLDLLEFLDIAGQYFNNTNFNLNQYYKYSGGYKIMLKRIRETISTFNMTPENALAICKRYSNLIQSQEYRDYYEVTKSHNFYNRFMDNIVSIKLFQIQDITPTTNSILI